MDIGYWAAAARAFARNLTTPGFLKGVARSGLDADAGPKAPVRFLLDAYPEVEGVPVEIGTMAFRRSNLGPMEQFCLASISRLRQPKTIFEVGTYDGATTL